MATNPIQPVLRWTYDRVWHWWPLMLWPLMRKYRRQHGRWPRILRPRAFTEKVLNRMLFDRRPILPKLAGKLESRDYVRARLGDGLLIPLLATIERAEDLHTLPLPERFFLKANHGSGMNHPHFGGPVDRAALASLCHTWLANNPAKWGREWVYNDTRRAVLLEPLLQDSNGEVPADYKLFCYDGQVRFITVIHSRFVDTCGHITTRDWVHIPGHIYFPADPGPPPPPPPQLPQLIAAAEALSAGFDFLRIDLYLVDGRPLFGEITTTPGGAHEKFNPPALDWLFGEPWTIGRSARHLASRSNRLPVTVAPRQPAFAPPVQPSLGDDRPRQDRTAQGDPKQD